jgi:hypothetical protein
MVYIFEIKVNSLVVLVVDCISRLGQQAADWSSKPAGQQPTVVQSTSDWVSKPASSQRSSTSADA